MEFGDHLEPCDITGVALACIPVTRNLDSIFLTEHRIQYGLILQPGRECAVAALLNQHKFCSAYRAKKCCRRLHEIVFSFKHEHPGSLTCHAKQVAGRFRRLR